MPPKPFSKKLAATVVSACVSTAVIPWCGASTIVAASTAIAAKDTVAAAANAKQKNDPNNRAAVVAV